MGLRLPKVSLICEWCGSVFAVHPFRAETARFCSRVCHYRTKQRPVLGACGGCGAPVIGVPSHVRRYCSIACQRAPARAVERFWARVEKTETCWLWRGTLNDHGYGELHWAGSRHSRTSRVAWELAAGEPPPSTLDVLHTCDTPNCVRNDEVGTYTIKGIELPRRGHLVLGTHADNMRDMIAKRRGRYNPAIRARGEQHPLARLTETQVRAIRQAASNGATPLQLAREYGVRDMTIRSIVQRKTWRHL